MNVTDEWALVKKLQSLELKVATVFDGVTTQAERREKVRAAVKQLPHVLYSIRGGKAVTLEQQFRVVYGCEL